jgi:hypothetical protein
VRGRCAYSTANRQMMCPPAGIAPGVCGLRETPHPLPFVLGRRMAIGAKNDRKFVRAFLAPFDLTHAELAATREISI